MHINNKDEFKDLIKDSKVLICDLDGTILDSEVKHFDAWGEIIRDYIGFIIDESYINRYISHDDFAICDMIRNDFGVSFDNHFIIEERRNKFLEYLEKGPLKKNEFLYEIIKDDNFCKNNKYIVTSQDIDIGGRELLNIGLQNTFDFGYFNVENKRDIYKLIVDVCKVDKNIKEGFLLFEDSPKYLEIGKNLGFKVIAVEHRYNKERIAKYIEEKGDIPVISF